MKKYDLEERTFQFAIRIRKALNKAPDQIKYSNDANQLIRSSASIGANYIEANESISKKDFVYRLRISRKEAKESAFWIRLINETTEEIQNSEFDSLFQESIELKKILSAIIEKAK